MAAAGVAEGDVEGADVAGAGAVAGADVDGADAGADEDAPSGTGEGEGEGEGDGTGEGDGACDPAAGCSGTVSVCGARLIPVELMPGEMVTGLTTVVAAPTGLPPACAVLLELVATGAWRGVAGTV